MRACSVYSGCYATLEQLRGRSRSSKALSQRSQQPYKMMYMCISSFPASAIVNSVKSARLEGSSDADRDPGQCLSLFAVTSQPRRASRRPQRHVSAV